jgi:hypothetical protein
VQRSCGCGGAPLYGGHQGDGATGRSVAQPGSAPASGAGGRQFESAHSDQFFQTLSKTALGRVRGQGHAMAAKSSGLSNAILSICSSMACVINALSSTPVRSGPIRPPCGRAGAHRAWPIRWLGRAPEAGVKSQAKPRTGTSPNCGEIAPLPMPCGSTKYIDNASEAIVKGRLPSMAGKRVYT